MAFSTDAWRTAPRIGAEPIAIDTLPPLVSGRTKKQTLAPTRVGWVWLVVLFLAVHVPMALAMERVPAVATAHALTVFAIGAWVAVASKRPVYVAMAIAYITGAEVLWRMTGAQIYWEFAKYAGSALALLFVVRHGRLLPPMLPLAYFALLLPSVTLTLANNDFAAARDQISFNLSGPFAILMCAWFFSKVRLSAMDVRAILVAAIGPAIAVAAVAASSTFSNPDIVFYDSSNITSSGGFGPNQVSAILGLGALLALFVAFDRTVPRVVQLVMAGALVGLAAQSALTFSRGGLYGASGGAAIAAAFAMRDARLRARLVPLLIGLFVIGNYFIFPYLDGFTGGQLGVRFQDTGLTGRDRLIRADIELWKDNPILGVGPGGGRAERGAYFLADSGPALTAGSVPTRGIAAHTEFSRLLSEHGTFGLAALVLLGIGVALNVRSAPTARTRAVTAGLAVWSVLFMVSNAMRILAPSFVIGMGFAVLFEEGGAMETLRSAAAPFARAPGGVRRLTDGHPSSRNPELRDRVG